MDKRWVLSNVNIFMMRVDYLKGEYTVSKGASTLARVNTQTRIRNENDLRPH